MEHFDCIIVGSGPAGLGCAFYLIEHNPNLNILILDKENVSTGGLRNDCKMNFTYPVGFSLDNWDQEQADAYLDLVIGDLKPHFMEKNNLSVYRNRAENLGVTFLEIRQSHLGTDGGLKLIHQLMDKLAGYGVTLALGEEVVSVDENKQQVTTADRTVGYDDLVLAPGRRGFRFLQKVMDGMDIPYVDHIVDIGIRVETRIQYYSIVNDYYDPKFIFPDKVRTFCTNSGNAHVVQERYQNDRGETFYSVNGHAWSKERGSNGLTNFAILKTVVLTEPVASGQKFAEALGIQAMHLSGGKPMMQRVGDFRLGKRSKVSSFNDDLYDFTPTLQNCTPGDISLAMPAKILRAIWKSMKFLDTIVPGILHPSTIMYYPEIKLYANKPVFSDPCFQTKDHVYMIGDGAGTSRGITAAWASGIRAARGILGMGTL